MALNPSPFETLTPSQFTTFTIPNTVNRRCHLHTPLLRIAVLDSPSTAGGGASPTIAAIIIPEHRETDWTFSTEPGHLQLLFNNPNVSRLILIGNNINPNSKPLDYVRTVVDPVVESVDKDKIELELNGLVIALHPRLSFVNGVPKPLFLTYEDDVSVRVIVDRLNGPFVGEFVVEDVELENNEFRRRLNNEFRRRLRFKRMPNLIQSQVVINPSDMELGLKSLRSMKKVKFEVDIGTLVQPYLTPMVSGISLIVAPVNDRNRLGFTPRALCLGVGGGALLSFLNSKLGFEVVGVEADEVVLNVARRYFGLNDGKSVEVVVGDAMKSVEGLNGKFDVVMVDLDSSEARSGISAPPLEFVKKSAFRAVKSLVYDHGVVVINVIPPNELFYETLVQKLQDVFHKVYAVDVKNDGNIVLMAMVSPVVVVSDDRECAFLTRLRAMVSGSYMDCIVEL
ncbi:uncharacterized protein LOC143618693 [Bidens hawaiensis]|uniref:uncharacterized protein LOC143618693 n=1 Tax=Bidens hawaiensis TaxID=980011 RepID=UPI00404A74DF